jgi:hypothetical protein
MQTIPKSRAQAISTFQRRRTIKQPPSCPNRLMITNIVAKNLPHPQEMSMYSLCSFHWKYIRIPSSRKVEIRHNLAKVGRIVLVRLSTCCRFSHMSKNKCRKINPIDYKYQSRHVTTGVVGSKSLYLPHRQLLQLLKRADVG